MADSHYRVGDIFEGGPRQLNRWITPVWALGGRVEFDGNKATIVYLPPSAEGAPAPEPEVEKPEVEKPEVEKPEVEKPKTATASTLDGEVVVKKPAGRPKKIVEPVVDSVNEKIVKPVAEEN